MAWKSHVNEGDEVLVVTTLPPHRGTVTKTDGRWLTVVDGEGDAREATRGEVLIV